MAITIALKTVSDLTRETSLIQRTQAALAAVADEVYWEPTNTDHYDFRRNQAIQSFRATEGYAQNALIAIVLDSDVQADASSITSGGTAAMADAITDVHLLQAVRNQWNKLAGVPGLS